MEHIKWLKKVNEAKNIDGKKISIYEFNYQNDKAVFSDWAKHFRNHYCSDSEIDLLRKGTNLSRAEYLTQMKFPDKNSKPGPSTRSGDFSEILVTDFFEYQFGYSVARTRYDRKTIKNESTKGSDIVAYKIKTKQKSDPKDELLLVEVKGKLAKQNKTNIVQKAIDDSSKDIFRKAETLNAIKQRYLDRNLGSLAMEIERFQDELDRPYLDRYGAVAVYSNTAFDEPQLEDSSSAKHNRKKKLFIIVIKGENLMKLANELYQVATDEA